MMDTTPIFRVTSEETQRIAAYLQKVQREINAILDDAPAVSIKGAINWGDLNCVEVELSVNVEGTWMLNAVIEEADPNNPDLLGYIVEQLKQRGYANVFVRAEW
mgnify:FL=1